MPAVMPVVGRRSWLPADITNMRLNNNIVRASIVASAPSVNSRIRIEWWDGSAWTNYLDVGVGVVGYPSADSFNMNTCQVLRNSVEECSLRYTGTITGVTGLCTIDLAVRRGSPLLFVDVSSTTTTAVWQAYTGLASTSYPLDAGGVGYMVANVARAPSTIIFPFVTGATATTGSTSDGRVTCTSATASAQFAFGSPFKNSSSSLPEYEVRAFYRALSESVRVVDF